MYRILNILSLRSSTPTTNGELCSPKREYLSDLLAYSSSIPTECNSGWLPAVTRGNAQLSRQIYTEYIVGSIQARFAFNTCLWREALSKRLSLLLVHILFIVQPISTNYIPFRELAWLEDNRNEGKWRISIICAITPTPQLLELTRPEILREQSTTTTNHKTTKSLLCLSRENKRTETLIFPFNSTTTRPQEPFLPLFQIFFFGPCIGSINSFRGGI